ENTASDEKSGKHRKKKHPSQRKKKKVDYQKKKGQLISKPANDKLNESKTSTSQRVVDKPSSTADVQKSQDKQDKTEENKKLRSQTFKANKEEEKDSKESKGHHGPNDKELPQTSTSGGSSAQDREMVDSKPGK
ncbi:hypothetical protein MHBO_004149, partial [Bonamia ostreae]